MQNTGRKVSHASDRKSAGTMEQTGEVAIVAETQRNTQEQKMNRRHFYIFLEIDQNRSRQRELAIHFANFG